MKASNSENIYGLNPDRTPESESKSPPTPIKVGRFAKFPVFVVSFVPNSELPKLFKNCLLNFFCSKVIENHPWAKELSAKLFLIIHFPDELFHRTNMPTVVANITASVGFEQNYHSQATVRFLAVGISTKLPMRF